MENSKPKARMRPGSSMPRVLVIEANPGYRSVISHVVELAGAQFESTAEFDHAKRQSDGSKRFDMIIVGTSAASPFTAQQVGKLRSVAQCPLIVLVESYDETKDTLEIYKAGADEVLPKPFVPDALIGAITAEMRRPGPVSVVPLAKRIELGGLVFDAELRRVTGRERFASFTKREWQLLTFFWPVPTSSSQPLNWPHKRGDPKLRSSSFGAMWRAFAKAFTFLDRLRGGHRERKGLLLCNRDGRRRHLTRFPVLLWS